MEVPKEDKLGELFMNQTLKKKRKNSILNRMNESFQSMGVEEEYLDTRKYTTDENEEDEF